MSTTAAAAAAAAAAIQCTAEDRIEVGRLSKSRTDEARRVERAKLAVRSLAARPSDEVAAEFGIQAATVGIWRRRFASEGLPGLNDRARSGKPPVYPAAELRQRILKQLEAPPPAWLTGTEVRWHKPRRLRRCRLASAAKGRLKWSPFLRQRFKL